MKSIELAELLKRWAVLVVPPPGTIEPLRALEELLEVHKSASVTTALTKLTKVEAPRALGADATWTAAVDYLGPIVRLVSDVAKPAIASDLKAFLKFATDTRGLDSSMFLTAARVAKRPAARERAEVPVRIDVVQKINRALEQSLGDDAGFNDVIKQIEVPGAVTTPELLLLAKQFALASTKSRNAALKKIRGRHDALMISRAKSAATSGRVAG